MTIDLVLYVAALLLLIADAIGIPSSVKLFSLAAACLVASLIW